MVFKLQYSILDKPNRLVVDLGIVEGVKFLESLVGFEARLQAHVCLPNCVPNLNRSSFLPSWDQESLVESTWGKVHTI